MNSRAKSEAIHTLRHVSAEVFAMLVSTVGLVKLF